MTESQDGSLNVADPGVSPTASTLPPPKPFTGHTASDFTVSPRGQANQYTAAPIAIGTRFCRLVVTGPVGDDGLIPCECDCGNQTRTRRKYLVCGDTTSCGCRQREVCGDRVRIHGLARTPEYRTWLRLRARCENPNCADYGNYGGRGIRVCERWASFDHFLADMGQRPTGTSIDRINNDGNYEPGNCRWASRIEQARNRRCNRMVSALGVRLTVVEWAERSGLKAATIWNRLNRGWTDHDAVTSPVLDPFATTQPMSPPPWPDNPLVPEPFEMACTVGEEGCA